MINDFRIIFTKPASPDALLVSTPLPEDQEGLLMTGGCHVDHEGYDLNEIEQAYYKLAGLSLTEDNTWYKDGGGDRTTNAIIQSWATQVDHFGQRENNGDQLILDHSMVVYKYPIVGEAEEQIKRCAKTRPELLRLVSTRFKCGLDLCIDLLEEDHVQPVVHIEWDFGSYSELLEAHKKISSRMEDITSDGRLVRFVKTVKDFNLSCRRHDAMDAFQQADFRSMLFFNDKAYKLIPTLW